MCKSYQLLKCYIHINACAWRPETDFILQQGPQLPRTMQTWISFWAGTYCKENQTSPCSSEMRGHNFQKSIRYLGSRSNMMTIVHIQSKLEFSYSAFSNEHSNAIGNIYTVVIDMRHASSVFYIYSVINR